MPFRRQIQQIKAGSAASLARMDGFIAEIERPLGSIEKRVEKLRNAVLPRNRKGTFDA